MKSKNRTKYLLTIFLTLSCISIISLTSLYIYKNQFMEGGWLWGYFAELIVYQRNGFIEIRNVAYPFTSFFLIQLSTILGEPILEIIFIPYLTSIPLLYSYIFTKYFISNKYRAILLSLIPFFTMIARTPHIKSYPMGMLLFPVFVFLVSKYIFSNDRRYIFLSILLLIGIKFYFPYGEVYSVTFLISISFCIFIFKRLGKINLKSNRISKEIYFLGIFSLVLLFSYQPKGETLLYDFYIGARHLEPFEQLSNFLFGLGNGSTLNGEYVVPRRAPQISFILNISLTLLIILVVAITFLFLLFKFFKHFKRFCIKDMRVP